jgi:hypothetical protein
VHLTALPAINGSKWLFLWLLMGLSWNVLIELFH